MAKDPFLLVSLEESESKALAQVISNDTARKILDFLSKQESATETDIARKLKIALSTVHYNLQALTKANLVQAEEFHYSEKGKEVLHYSLANKVIIIAPKKVSSESFRDKLRSLLPVGLIALATAGVLQLFSMFRQGVASSANSGGALMAKQAVVENAPVAVSRLMTVAADSANATAANAAETLGATAPQALGAASPQALAATASPVQAISTQPAIALWFLIGAVFTILVLVIWYFFATRKKK